MHILQFLAPLALLPSVTLGAPNANTDSARGWDLLPVNFHSAQDVIAKLNLTSNPEKGYYVQTFEDTARVNPGNRSASTLIYYLLEGKAGDSVWHRVTDAAEVWHYYAGAPLTLSLSHNDGTKCERHVLGQEIFQGQAPQVVIVADQWQSARSHGAWTLVGTTGKPGLFS